MINLQLADESTGGMLVWQSWTLGSKYPAILLDPGALLVATTQ